MIGFEPYLILYLLIFFGNIYILIQTITFFLLMLIIIIIIKTLIISTTLYSIGLKRLLAFTLGLIIITIFVLFSFILYINLEFQYLYTNFEPIGLDIYNYIIDIYNNIHLSNNNEDIQETLQQLSREQRNLREASRQLDINDVNFEEKSRLIDRHTEELKNNIADVQVETILRHLDTYPNPTDDPNKSKLENILNLQNMGISTYLETVLDHLSERLSEEDVNPNHMHDDLINDIEDHVLNTHQMNGHDVSHEGTNVESQQTNVETEQTDVETEQSSDDNSQE